MNKVYVVGAKRTAIGTFGGTLKDIPAVTLGVTAAKAAMEQAGVSPDRIDETIVGNILTAGQGMGPGRQVAVYAGVPVEKPALTVNMLCASGMKSVMMGAIDIIAGEAELVLAGGTESMSQAPFLLPKGRYGYRMGNGVVLDHMVMDGLTDVFNSYHMGVTAENLADKYGISRTAQDAFAYESQLKAKAAIENGRFAAEIAPVIIKTRKDDMEFSVDEHPRLATPEQLAKLRSAFAKEGTVTAGNASGINDGASMVVLASEKAVEELVLEPMAEILAFSQVGVDPAFMGIGPVPAIRKVLDRAGMSIEDIELFELNEAFAAQSLAVFEGLEEEHGVDKNLLLKKTNVNGGAIALGHPIGASGNRIIVTLLYEMKKRGLKYGLASLCVGGGMGTAMIVKNLGN